MIDEPHDHAAEQAVIGAMLIRPESFWRIADLLDAGDFYRQQHREVFAAMAQMIRDGKTPDVVTIGESVGDLGYLIEIGNNTPGSANIAAYAEIVAERAEIRRVRAAGREIASLTGEGIGQAAKLLTGAMRARGEALRSVNAVAKEWYADLTSRLDRTGELTGITTGLSGLDELTGGWQEEDLIIIAARPSMGKAQPLDAKVLTLSGWKLMGEVAIGDRLASTDGAESVVTGVFPQGPREVFAVTFSDGRTAEACAEHLWEVTYRDWKTPRVVTTAKMAEMLTKVRYQNRLWVESFSGEFGSAEPLPLDPWLLGALIGDGNLCSGGVRFSSADPENLDRVRATLPAGVKLRHSGQYDWSIALERRGGANPVATALSALGLMGHRGETKFIPRAYLQACRQARSELLCGLLDTDGWVEKFGAIRFCTVSKQLAEDVVYLVRSLGGSASASEKSTTYTYRGESHNGRLAYVVNIQHQDAAAFISVPHKLRRAERGRKRQCRMNVRSITRSRVTETQCISVSHPRQLYVTNDFVLTHNTASALHFATSAASAGAGGLIFSLEMGAKSLMNRMVGSIARVPSDFMRDPKKLENEHWARITVAMGDIAKMPLRFDDSAGITADSIIARTRQAHAVSPIRFVIIDYLQLISLPNAENRSAALGDITRALKCMCKELKITCLLLSQLNRGLEQRADKRPIMSDLRESGAIEQDADLIAMLYRDEVYNENSRDKGFTEMVIRKHRNGPIGTVVARSDLRFGLYSHADQLPSASYQDEPKKSGFRRAA